MVVVVEEEEEQDWLRLNLDLVLVALGSKGQDPNFSTEGYPFGWQQQFPFRFQIGCVPLVSDPVEPRAVQCFV